MTRIIQDRDNDYILFFRSTDDQSSISISYNSHCLFIVSCLRCVHLIHQDKFLVGVKSFLVRNLVLILILIKCH